MKPRLDKDRLYRANNPDKVAAWSKASYEKRVNESPNKIMWSNAKQRAKRKGLSFTITPDDIVIPTHCPIFKIKLKRSSTNGPCPTSPSLDRVVSNLGYVPGNVRVISNMANRLKSDLTIEQAECLLAYMKESTSG